MYKLSNAVQKLCEGYIGQQTGKQTDKQTFRTRTVCPRSFDPGHKNKMHEHRRAVQIYMDLS